MDALREIANLLIQTFFYLYILALLLRLLLQLAKADFYNPISQFLVKVTQPVLAPSRHMIPSIGRLDTATIVIVLLLQIIATAALVLIQGYDLPNLLALVMWSAIGTVSLLVNIYFFGILASIILSWVAPGSYNPTILLLHQLTEPVMTPFRKLLPSMGGLDLSPIFVFLTINILQIIINNLANSAGLPATYVIDI